MLDDNFQTVIHHKISTFVNAGRHFLLDIRTAGTAVAQWVQIGRSLVRFQMVSLEFFIDVILPITLWPWGRLSL